MVNGSRLSLATALAAALLLLGQGCNEGGGLTPPTNRTPATLRKVSGDSQSAPAGAVVAVSPEVVVLDAGGKPVDGAIVTFAVTSGGGALLGSTDTTKADGVARLGTWILGTSLGVNTVTATTGQLAVTFTAVATAGASATFAKRAGDGQTATVGALVPTPPSVLVSDSLGNPVAGVHVLFQVMIGGGYVSGTTPTSDANGIATVGAWYLGTSAGLNTLMASAPGLPPVTFSATGTAGPAFVLAKLAGDQYSGPVGSAVLPVPTVVVSDQFGNSVAGVAVTFEVTGGGGSITGATATSAANGVAAIGSWTLGTTIGANTVVAKAAGLPPTTFTAAATAGPPATIVAQAGDSQTVAVGSPVPVRPAVRLRDAYGNPVRGIVVTFLVTSGGGVVQNSTPTSDSVGVAAVGSWTLGPVPGPNTLSASVQGLPPVTFTATSVNANSNCSVAMPYAIGASVTGTLSATSCLLSSGAHVDWYATRATATQLLTFTMSSTAFYTSLSLFDSSGATIDFASDYCNYYYSYPCGPINSSASVSVLVGAGSYVLGASSSDPNVTGSYTVTSKAADQNVTNCAYVLLAPGTTTSQRIELTDCKQVFRDTTYYFDQFNVNLVAGRSYTITMTSADFDAYLELSFNGQTVATNDDYAGTTNSQIVFTPTQSGQYTINAATYLGNKTGNYTLTVK